MKRIFTITLSIGIFLFATTYNSGKAASPLEGHVIVVDAGHGGTDSGSTACEGYPEKTANLDIANRLRTLLENDYAQVVMTREDDSTLSNEDRYTKANTAGGEALVSVHLNGSTNANVNGTLGLYGKKNKDLKFTEVMHADMPAELGVTDLGVTNFASGVLLKSNMPATISETVFISNTDECVALRDGDGTRQQEIAQSLYNGFLKWFSQNPDSGGDDEGSEPTCPANSNSPKCR